ncbi:MAG TPA: DPP IV N-terminal domain-containing protein [candidate division Zixibacteria bacterium]|nr:DPP IV N-terminal domain-containing protein [candidate division Zixibacteria bacterium]
MGWPSLEDISRLPYPGTSVPGSLAFAPDGSALTYLHSPDESLVRSLWWHDLVSGERWVIAGPPAAATSEEALTLEQQLRRERTRTTELGVTEYQWAISAMVPTLLVPVAGELFVAVGDGVRRGVRLLAGASATSAACLAPDGRHVAFVRDGDVWVAPLEGAAPWQLTRDAEPGVFNGVAEYVAAEELDRQRGMWWSTDGTHLAIAQADERGVRPFVISHLGEDQPVDEVHRYPFAGEPNALVRLRIGSLDGSLREVDLGAAEDDYLARVVAHPHGGWLAAVLPRHQRSLRWLRVGIDGGCSELWEEAAEPWINLDHDTRVLADGRVLRSTERTGFRHLELRAADGGVRQLTGGPWMVTQVVHVDEQRGEVLFMGTRHGATERHLYRVPLDARRPVDDPERLTGEPGWHAVVVSRDGSRWVDTWSDLEHAPRVELRHRDDPAARVAIHEPTTDAAMLGIRPPELLTLTADDGVTPLDAALFRPTQAAGAGDGAPPAVVWVYGGPHAQHVKRSWDLTILPLRQYLAAAGAAVLVVDNRGSHFRGLAFEAPLERALGEVEVADQVAAVRQLAARGELDASRVAITGGSYGGYMTIRAMARHPDLFRAGVAVAPVTDWGGYDTAYTERYLGTPQDAPEAYRAASLLDEVDGLTGDLLILHGALDENVHLRHSIRLLGRLQRAGRDDVELVILPRDRHRTRTPEGLRTRDRRTVRHLLTGIGLPLPDEARAPDSG